MSSGKSLIKITYDCGFYDKFYEYLCLPDYYSGFAVEKAKTWWAERTDEPFPETVDEFMFLADQLLQPAAILVVKEGKYNRVIGCKFVETGDVNAGEIGGYAEEVPF